MILYQLMKASRLLAKFWYATTLAVCFSLLSLTGSRLGLRGTFQLGGISACRRPIRAVDFSGGTPLVDSICVLGGRSNLLLANLPAKVSAFLTPEGRDIIFGGTNSTGLVRLNLAKNGLLMAWRTAGIGVGAGNFESYLETHSMRYPTGRTFSPHNGLVEVLAQYGVLIFVGVLILMFRILRRALGHRHWSAPRPGLVLGLMAVAVGTLSNNSSYLDPSFMWVAFSMFFVAVEPPSRLPLKKATHARHEK